MVAITPSAHGVLVSGAAGTAAVTATGNSGQVLTSNGASADPTFQAAPVSTTLTTKGDLQTFTTVNARHAVPNDYGMIIADSAQSDGWRNSTYNQTQGKPGKNYIQYADFENNATTGWGLGTTGTLTNGLPTGSPTFGSGASGNLSLAIVSSGQLSGTYSLSYVSSAATTSGNMVASSAYTIDSSDQAKVLSFKFNYSAFSGSSNCNFSGTSSNSFGVAVYDVTNSAWLPVNGAFNLVQGSGVGSATGTFQTAITTASIRFIIYNANATAGAATMYFDDFFVGPQISVLAPAMSDVNNNLTFTVNNSGTVTNSTIFSWREADRLKVRGAFNSGTVSASAFSIQLPSGYTIDSTKIGGTNIQEVGTLLRINGTAAIWSNQTSGPWPMYYDGSTNNKIFFASNSSSSAFTAGNSNALWNSGDAITFEFSIPITGWSSNTVMSSDTDTRVVAAKYKCSTGPALAQNDYVNFDTKIIDTHSAVTTGTGTSWKFTAPVTGYYQVEFTLRNPSAGASFLLYKNGISDSYFFTIGTATDRRGSSTVVQCNTGDTLSILADTGTTLTSDAATNQVSIFRLTGPAVISATESVNARYYASSSSISGSLGTVVWATKDFDSHGGMTSGTYTVPVSGKYQVNAALLLSGTFILNSTMILELQKNGTVVSRFTEYSGGAETNMKGDLSDVISCLAGDTLRIQVSTSGTGPAVVSSNFDNYMSLVRVGN